jgi:hypothetical protein
MAHRRKVAHTVVLVATAGVLGCGTVSYKLGGTQGDYQAARERCRNAGRAEGSDFERCMQEQEWTVKRLGERAAPDDAKRNVPAERPSAGLQPAPAAGDGPPPPSKLGETPAPAVEQPIVVKAWFKLGGSAGELEAAKTRCVTKLGAAHRPEPESHVVTGEMLACLRDEGWVGLR